MTPSNNFENLPIYLKGREIEELVRRILELVPEDKGMLREVADWMLADAANLFVKVAGAESENFPLFLPRPNRRMPTRLPHVRTRPMRSIKTIGEGT